ncbi:MULTISPECIES: hypothetical protein [Rhizobium]|uniref:Secreted protein n=1 Tax=Rhizobium phaseoli TaxID=396 RepID=A0A192TGL5_9HYPH|nr:MULTISPECIES: hypothetical protein [Rhizobium]ANL42299.1 hypothetical protein AMC88_CH03965 [Rhizobium phaseoli]ANL55013.1 hypothetical protein AMC86_CH03929 [Rhizobium phaseoli]ANL61285.1 hypothetical protein AMC85_CH03962 [Rhizobium phaseoli]ANL86650.1 hypothetical protein AMC81_CH03932 [Rhizobium phaseoli]ANL93159.1 hypothetical protein AMC80_CH03934 [Rhizobium phaseoli]
MRKIILNCTVAALAACSFAAPVLADSVYVRERTYDDDGYRQERVRPGITISERGVTFGVREREHRGYRNDGCETRSVTRQTEDGEVTRTVRRCY